MLPKGSISATLVVYPSPPHNEIQNVRAEGVFYRCLNSNYTVIMHIASI